ncbi:MAG: DUF3892 domain-containing protein [Candidatus Saccharibacteria bacterium]
MSIQITAIRLSGGATHQHITRLWWTNPSTGQADNNTRAEIVAWIETKNGKAYVDDANGHRADVKVVTPSYGQKYLRTYADGVWTDNLLALPAQVMSGWAPVTKGRRPPHPA